MKRSATLREMNKHKCTSTPMLRQAITLGLTLIRGYRPKQCDVVMKGGKNRWARASPKVGPGPTDHCQHDQALTPVVKSVISLTYLRL